MEKGVFSDLLVIDCASFIAGPAAATIMSDFGARVIKIEPPEIGDSYRQLKYIPGMPKADQDYFWILDNRNKESLALDLKHPDARAVLEDLIAKADVFITNFPGPIRERLRLRAEDILPLNDRLIYASLTPYGEAGPEKDRTGYDATAYWARSGLMDAVRPNQQIEPAISVPGMGDHPTAVALYSAITTALYRRERTGKGGAVSTSLLANGLWANAAHVQAAIVDADFSIRLQRGQRGALTELYECKDGRWFMFAMLNYQREWPLLVEAIGKPEWLSDARFENNEARRGHTAELVGLMSEIFLTRDWQEWRAVFQAAGLTYGPISRPEDHMVCPQVAANGYLPEIAGSGGMKTVDSPVHMADEVKRTPGVAPKIGEHSRAVLQFMGYETEAIDQLMAKGAVA